MLRFCAFVLSAFFFLTGCRPKPLDIVIEQEERKLAISSACLNDDVVHISASYTLSSLRNTHDTSAEKDAVQRAMLVDSGVATITRDGGQPMVLPMICPGVFGSAGMRLTAGSIYHLSVRDLRKGYTARATTVFVPKPQLDTLYPERVNGTNQYRLNFRVKNAAPNSYYFASYTATAPAQRANALWDLNAGALQMHQPKRIQLFSTSVSETGLLEKSFPMDVKPTDTVVVQIGQIDRAYYNFLDAYKRSGTLINQLSGEPVNMPTNIKSGYGFFSLFEPVRKVWYMPQM